MACQRALLGAEGWRVVGRPQKQGGGGGGRAGRESVQCQERGRHLLRRWREWVLSWERVGVELKDYGRRCGWVAFLFIL